MENKFLFNFFLIVIIFMENSNSTFINNKDIYDFEGIEDRKFKLGVKIPYGAVFYYEPDFRVVDIQKINNLNFHLSKKLNQIAQNECRNERCMKVVNVKDSETLYDNGPSENDIINEEDNFVLKTRRIRSENLKNKAILDVIDSVKEEQLLKAVPGKHKVIEETFKKLKESVKSGEEKVTKKKAARSNAGSVFELLAEETDKPSEETEEHEIPELLSLVKLLSITKQKPKNFSSKKY